MSCCPSLDRCLDDDDMPDCATHVTCKMDDLLQKRAAFKRDLLRLLDAINTGQSVKDVSKLGSALIKTSEGFDAKGVDALQVDPHELATNIDARMAELWALE